MICCKNDNLLRELMNKKKEYLEAEIKSAEEKQKRLLLVGALIECKDQRLDQVRI